MYELAADDQTLTGRVRPFRALRALIAFVCNPDDTPQVFRVVRALDGSTAERAFLRFCATRTGRAILARDTTLAEVLADRVRLRALPHGTLGRHYLSFVEAERISMDGLLQAGAHGGFNSARLEQARLKYRGRLQAMHDLLHVITGYGTDELGEGCLLAFTYAQNRTRGLLPLTYGLAVRMVLHYPRLQVMPAIREGFEGGKCAAWLASQDWESLLARPLAEVRDRLNVLPPKRYLAQASLSQELDERRRRRLA